LAITVLSRSKKAAERRVTDGDANGEAG
jgi:hypothetical protein